MLCACTYAGAVPRLPPEPGLPATSQERAERWESLLRQKNERIGILSAALEDVALALVSGNTSAAEDTVLTVLGPKWRTARRRRAAREAQERIQAG